MSPSWRRHFRLVPHVRRHTRRTHMVDWRLKSRSRSALAALHDVEPSLSIALGSGDVGREGATESRGVYSPDASTPEGRRISAPFFPVCFCDFSLQDLRCLPIFLSGCRSFVVFAGPSYLSRLCTWAGSCATSASSPSVGRGPSGKTSPPRGRPSTPSRWAVARASCPKTRRRMPRGAHHTRLQQLITSRRGRIGGVVQVGECPARTSFPPDVAVCPDC